MSRGHAARWDDVMRIVDAARAVARDRASIAADLVATTGLSAEGVELAFERHLELTPTPAEVDALVRGAGDAPLVLVLLSANVFVAALRAIALARATSAAVVVRPSRREPHFARSLVEHSRDPGLSLAGEVDLARLSEGEVHVYGRDATIADVRSRVARGVRVLGHGAGMGVAVVTEGVRLEDAASALAADVVPFDQRGCLSPRVAIALGDAERATQLGAALDASLARSAEHVPRGDLHAGEREESARYVAAMTYAGTVFDGADHVIGVGPAGGPLVVPPPGRHVHVVPARTLEEAHSLLTGVAHAIVAVGSDDPGRVALIAPPHARLSLLGAMQRPPLDGPVDRRDPARPSVGRVGGV